MALPALAAVAGNGGLALAYAWYVAALGLAVRLAVLLSLLVSADRILNVTKYAFIRARARLTGRLPKDSWFCAPLPRDAEDHPMVGAGAGRPGWGCGCWVWCRRRTRQHPRATPMRRPRAHAALTPAPPPPPRALNPNRLPSSYPCSTSGRCARPSSIPAQSWSGPRSASRFR